MKIIFVIFLFLPGKLFSQEQEIKILAHNILFGGITAGVGAVINKTGTENWKKSFVRGFWQGSVGGLIIYSSKKTIQQINKNKNLGYAVPARLINSVGNSIIQNASANKPFLKHWNLEYCFLRIDFAIGNKKNFRLRLLPESIVSSVLSLSKGSFDLKTTLITGVMSFKKKNLISTLHGYHDGISYGRAFIYVDDSLKYHLISHEIIHEYQYREYLVFNPYLGKEVKKIKETGFKKFLARYIYPDLPYFGLFYMIEGNQPSPRFYRNYYEMEAERFASDKDVLVN